MGSKRLSSDAPELCAHCGGAYAVSSTHTQAGRITTWRIFCTDCKRAPDDESSHAPRYRQPDILPRRVKRV